MSEVDGLFFVICFTIVIVFLHGIRDRLKRLEEKLDSIAKRFDQK
jgi:hypothetical protein